ncbi:peptidoglycan editing factor PgeF [Parabacteroides sp. FAFU027]|uniref:peptidoglycan editing factor PgeF n=1 Tax=Parabacteroides sp. FAFU027 TaxID=2922715 RepID=UPI001FAEEC44|nr:peptidoglycan editing factor PgeF [Parabacteroides sp. FAFU027]
MMKHSPELLRFPSLEKYTGLTHFVTTRHGGVSTGNYDSFSLGLFSGDNPDSVAQNRTILCNAIGISSDKLFIPYQTHSDLIGVIDGDFISQNENQQVQLLNGVDALITDQTDICIGVTTADCVPVLIYDPVKKVAGLAHAGWRGTVARIAGKTVRKMNVKFGCNPKDLVAAIGPSIGPDAFEVGADVADEFRRNGFAQTILSSNHKQHIDLWKANQQDLLEAGLQPHQIEIAGICTFTEHERFFSARRLGVKSGRLVTGIIIR